MNYEKKLVIFVVEDNPIYQQLIARQLEPVSNSLSIFASGEDCLERLIKAIPDMIVMDNNLEGELTGLQTVQQIRKKHPVLYVLVFSTEQGLDSPENLKFYGDFDYVEKKETAFALLRDKVASSKVYLSKTLLKTDIVK